jgi:hypothetical protein
MSETSLNSGYGWNLSVAQWLSRRFQALAPYAALAVIAGLVFGTLSTHPF